MSVFYRFYHFMEELFLGKHDLQNDSIKVYLSNTAPNVSTHEGKSDVAGISTGNGYDELSVVPEVATRYYYQYRFTGTDMLVITANGGTVGPFRYVILYNDSHPTDGLIGYWDRGYSITLQDGESIIADMSYIFQIDVSTMG